MMEFEGFQKLVSRNLEFNNKAVEETLLGVGKWALLSLRIPGYFPLTICRSNSGLRLELVKCSTVAFYTIFITILTLLGNGFFYYKFIKTFLMVDDRPDSPSTNYGDVESFVWFSLMVLVTYTTYLRFSRIFFCRGSLRFWEMTVALIETIVNSGYSLNSTHFQNTFSRIRSWVIFYFTIAGIRISYGGYVLYTDWIDPEVTNSILATSFLDFFLAITLCFHVGYNVWLTFLVKIITICYETIHEDLDGMSCPRREDSSSFKTPDTFRHHPMGLGFYAVTSGGGGGEMEKKNKIGFLHLERKIEQTIKTYEVVEEHMHHFNRFFGVTLIMETTFAIIILLVNVYAGETSIFSSPRYTIIVMGTPIIIYSSSLFHFSSDSAILSGRAVAVLKKLERFFIPNDRQELQALQLKVIALIARVADNPPTISAAHFFTLNRHLLTSVLGTITTYLIVLFQFRGNDTPPVTVAPTTAAEICPADLTWICYCGRMLKQFQKSNHTAYTH